MADWLDEPDDAAGDGWVVARAILAGALTLFVGASESFKSWAALWLIRAALTGGQWMGRDVVRFDRVYYAGNEKTRRSLKQRARVIFGDLPREATSRLHMRHREGLQFGTLAWDAFVNEVVAGDGTALVILDTLTSLTRSGYDENVSRDVSVVLSSLRALIDGERITVVLLHHPARGDQDRGRGWSGIDGEVDGTLLFNRPNKNKTAGHIRVNPKDGEQSRIGFTWDPETFEFEVEDDSVCNVETIVRAVRSAYEDTGRGVTVDELAVTFNQQSRGTVGNAITAAKKAGLIEVQGHEPAGPRGGAPKPIWAPTGVVSP
jgi:hypothetical protein